VWKAIRQKMSSAPSRGSTTATCPSPGVRGTARRNTTRCCTNNCCARRVPGARVKSGSSSSRPTTSTRG
jgi:hypothetical protein